MIRFVLTDLNNYEIIITGRTKHFLSLCGEHLSVDNMSNAIQLTAKDFNISIKEFCVEGITDEDGFGHHWSVAMDDSIDQSKFSALLDENLKKLNDDYKTERTSALKKFKVNFIPLHHFYNFMDQYARIGGQSKFPRVVKGTQLNNWKNYLKENKL